MKRTILIIEDDTQMQYIYQTMFKGEPFGLVMASNAKEGLVKLKKNKCDLIILDVIMDDMSGDTFFVKLRDQMGIHDIPVIIVSVLGERVLGNLKGMDNVRILEKPIEKEYLLDSVQEMLS